MGYDYEATETGAGKTWRVNTYWRVLAPNQEPLALFIHVLDDANTVRAGWDGLYVSPESWETGDVFIQAHLLHLPGDMPTGRQRVELGVYSPITMERLALYAGAENDTVPHNRAILRSLTVH